MTKPPPQNFSPEVFVNDGDAVLVIHNNKVIHAHHMKQGTQREFWSRGQKTVIETASSHSPNSTAPVSQQKELRSPMPGRITKLLVNAGDTVNKGTPLVVVEAMKMENELKASHDAVVEAILVREGDHVEAKKVLIRFAEL